MTKYIISVNCIKDVFGEKLDTPKEEFAAYDTYAGPMSTGFPVFDNLSHAISFNTPEEAEEWFRKNKYNIDLSRYDRSSLSIKRLVFKTVRPINK